MIIAAMLALSAPVGEGPACAAIPDYASWKEEPGQVWDYRGNGIVVIGAVHTRDPAHEQFARIATMFEREKPTVAFFEGPDRGIAPTSEETIRTAGESGYLRFLASAKGVETRSLEPSPGEQMKALLTDFPADQVLLFFVLREATRLGDREGLSGETLAAAVGKLLGRVREMAAAAGQPLPFGDIGGLQSRFQHYWPGRDWKTADARWFSPTADDAETGGVFAGRINRADSANRDRHMAALLSRAAAESRRPIAVVGRNHVPMLAPQLDCAAAAKPR
jgi:hypothetical protein